MVISIHRREIPFNGPRLITYTLVPGGMPMASQLMNNQSKRKFSEEQSSRKRQFCCSVVQLSPVEAIGSCCIDTPSPYIDALFRLVLEVAVFRRP